MDNSSELVIEAGKVERHYWKDLWRYRGLFYFLAWRDILVRYKQTVIGLAWALIRPLLTMIVFVFVFDKLVKLPSEGVPYPILVFAALLPWQFFSNAFTEAGNSLIGNASMISKGLLPSLGGTHQCGDRELCRLSDFGDYSGRADALVWLCA